MTHHAGVQSDHGAHRAACRTCAWTSRWTASKKDAVYAAQTHEAVKCGKVRYPSEHAATVALVGARAAQALRESTRRREQRAYFCAACSAWHLTSQPARVKS